MLPRQRSELHKSGRTASSRCRELCITWPCVSACLLAPPQTGARHQRSSGVAAAAPPCQSRGAALHSDACVIGARPRGSPRTQPVPGGAELRCAGRGHDACQHAQRPAGLPALLRRVQPGARRPPDWAARSRSDWAARPRARRRSAARQALREPAPPLQPALPRRRSHAAKRGRAARRRTPSAERSGTAGRPGRRGRAGSAACMPI